MNVASPDNNNMKKWTRRLAAPFLALVLVGSVVTYECVKPSSASAAAVPAPAPAAAALDANSVSALTAIDKAMETLAARVTPAVVNVTVVSKSKPESASTQTPDDMQQFFGQNGQNGPFGQFFGPLAIAWIASRYGGWETTLWAMLAFGAAGAACGAALSVIENRMKR